MSNRSASLPKSDNGARARVRTGFRERERSSVDKGRFRWDHFFSRWVETRLPVQGQIAYLNLDIVGAIESVFDFRQEWFGIESGISDLRPGELHPPNSQRLAVTLASRMLQRRDLTACLRNKVERERGTIQALLGAQSK